MPSGYPTKGRPTPQERFWRLVRKSANPDGCWQWLGQPNHDGYGRFNDGVRNVMAHRFAYETLVAPIPPELESDHLCKNRGCVNPSHIRPTTHAENMVSRDQSRFGAFHRAKTHCPKGHAYHEENTYFRPDRPSGRGCRTCRDVQNAKTTVRRVAANAARRGGRKCACGAPSQILARDGRVTCRGCHMREVGSGRYA